MTYIPNQLKHIRAQLRRGEEVPVRQGRGQGLCWSQFPTVTLLSAGAENFASIGAAGERHGQTVIRVLGGG